jgi:hypothetical protein
VREIGALAAAEPKKGGAPECRCAELMGFDERRLNPIAHIGAFFGSHRST